MSLTPTLNTVPLGQFAGGMKPPAENGGRPSGRVPREMERFSRAEIYLHLVWATYRRMPMLVGDAERVAYACIVREVKRAGCKLLAIGGMPDHVHVAVALAPAVAPARLVQQMKGVSSAAVRTQVLPGAAWGWQDGYGAYSFSRSHVDRVIAYVRNQKQHHGSGSTWAAWETTAADERER